MIERTKHRVHRLLKRVRRDTKLRKGLKVRKSGRAGARQRDQWGKEVRAGRNITAFQDGAGQTGYRNESARGHFPVGGVVSGPFA